MENYIEKSRLLKSLAHPIRLQIIQYLEQHTELTVNTLQQKLQIEQSHLSHHLALMKQRNVLKSRREGTHYFYYLAGDNVKELLKCLNRF